MDIIKKIKIDIPDIKPFVDETFKLPVVAQLKQGRAQVAAASLMGVFTLNLSEPMELVIPGFDDEQLIDERFGRWYVKEEENKE